MELKFIIYLIIGILWVIFNVVKKKQQAAGKNTAAPSEPAPRPSSKLPEEFTFLEDLLKGAEPEEKKEEEVLPPRPVYRAKKQKSPEPILQSAFETKVIREEKTNFVAHRQSEVVESHPEVAPGKIHEEEAASSLVYSLSSSHDIRQAFIWSEILNRPYR